MGYKLYVFLRSDLASMTPGKAAAQVAHAASQAAWNLKGTTTYSTWANESIREFGEYPHYAEFGTTIVLDAGSFEDTFDAGEEYPFWNISGEIQWGSIKDPTYPLKDGKKTHFIDIFTCYWLFADPDYNPSIKEYLKQFKLYDGNHD